MVMLALFDDLIHYIEALVMSSGYLLACPMSRHYKQAYTHLTELRMIDSNLLEAKTVGGFINYKASCILYIDVLHLLCTTTTTTTV